MSAVTNNKFKNRYELDIDGKISVADYQLNDKELVITHVGVPPELRGQGVAAKVMEAVVEDANAHGLTIVPVCSYAATYMARHKL